MHDISRPAKLLSVSLGITRTNNADTRQVMMIADILKHPVIKLPSGCPIAAQQRADLMGTVAIVKRRVPTCSWYCYNWSAGVNHCWRYCSLHRYRHQQWRSWLRHRSTSRKVAGSIPDGVIGIFYLHNPSGRTMALGSTQPITVISTRDVSWE
jgi:hypothetical protein